MSHFINLKRKELAYSKNLRALDKIAKIYVNECDMLHGAYHSDFMKELNEQRLHCKECISNVKTIIEKLRTNDYIETT